MLEGVRTRVEKIRTAQTGQPWLAQSRHRHEKIEIFNQYISSLSRSTRAERAVVNQPLLPANQTTDEKTDWAPRFGELTTELCVRLRVEIQNDFPRPCFLSDELTRSASRLALTIKKLRQARGRLPAESEIARALELQTSHYQNLLLFLVRARAIALQSPQEFFETLLSLPDYLVAILHYAHIEKRSEVEIAQRLGESERRIAMNHASALYYLTSPWPSHMKRDHEHS